MVILFSLSFVEKSSGQLGWGHLEGLNLELRNLKLVNLLEFEVEAFFMSNCDEKFIGFGNMNVLFNILPCGTPLEIIRNF